MKKNAFTLIELIAVIVILSIVLTLSVPSLIGALKNNKEKSLEKINELIILAAKDYVVDYGLEIPRKITQNELCKNYLDCPIINPVTKEEMVFSVIVDENKNYTIDKNELIELKVVLNGGKLSKDISGGYTPNTEIILETPTRERHGFAGWEIVSGDAVIEGSVLKLGTKNSTLVANWVGTPVKLNVDLDGGVSSINYNSEYYTRNTLDLGTPTKKDYAFIGWKLVSGDAVLSGNKLTFGLENVSVKATWIKVVEEFAYTGSEQVYTTPVSSYYKIQTWGAQGGNVSSTDFGGYGAYATETVYLEKGSKLYINVGGAGSVTTAESALAGGYNGGGNAFGASNGKKVGSGGGATHIATSSGLLSSFSGKKDSILIVAAGGGGGGYEDTSMHGAGGSGGGITGVSGTGGSAGTQVNAGSGQSSGAFGKGGSSTNDGTGGGAGYYGGGGGLYYKSAGGGSSYIGYFGYNKSVYCYNCRASNGTDTKTISGTCTSKTQKENCAKVGSGYAIISVVSGDDIDPIIKDKEYDNINGEQTFTAPVTGYYKLEVWGGQGGNVSTTDFGGYGGYSTGVVYLEKGKTIYINVGGAGSVTTSPSALAGGYNGGGNAFGAENNKKVGSGGGATHIATVSGLLSTLSTNQQAILIVAGAGGGGGYEDTSMHGAGGSAGGFLAVSGTGGSAGSLYKAGSGQSSGAFGKGGSSTNDGTGGGAGYYGGGGGLYYKSGGGGSSYIGNTLLLSTTSLRKTMYCYNCQSNNSFREYTKSTTCTNSAATKNCAKKGAGYAKVTHISDLTIRNYQVNDYEEFYNIGSIQTFTAPLSGTYKLEVWGASGGSANTTDIGGYGAYATGNVNLNKGDILYIAVGGAGSVTTAQSALAGGYNGGGNAFGAENGKKVGSGGGATHIAKVTGLLQALSSKKDSILIVAAGGGGGGYESASLHGAGGSGGGIVGVKGTNSTAGSQTAAGSGQSSGAFGKGGSSTDDGTGGGAGLYGGGGGLYYNSGAGGSSYIGNSLLTNKAMYCYNCTASSNTATKTISTTCTSSSPTKNCSKSGAGHAVITYIGE